MDSTSLTELEKRLWDAANTLWAGASLKPAEYSPLVLGLIFLKFADHRFSVAQEEIEGKSSGRREIGKTDYQARGVLSSFKSPFFKPYQATGKRKHRQSAQRSDEGYRN